jgi:formylglycine-generating enzyme required for sulfatase activity
MKRLPVVVKTALVVVFATVLSTLAINASDNFSNFTDSFLAMALRGTEQGPCPQGMALIMSADGQFCIDKYEASAGDGCEFPSPATVRETTQNVNNPECKTVSKEGKQPWRFIAFHQAETMCVKSGKRLPTNKEWYQASIGTPDIYGRGSGCALGMSASKEPSLTGNHKVCVSASGVYDMIGNVWEWVDGVSEDGEYEERTLPVSGYVAEIDRGGVARRTDPDKPDPIFNDDYFWMDESEVRGMIRGGYWGNDTDAGIYGVNASILPTFSGTGVGFRCVSATR